MTNECACNNVQQAALIGIMDWSRRGERLKMYLSRLKRIQGTSGIWGPNRQLEENSSDGLSLGVQAHDHSWLLNR